MDEDSVSKSSNEYYLVLDIGTHAVRAALVKQHLAVAPDIVFLSKKTYKLSRLSSSHVEQDADDILAQTRLVFDEALQYAVEHNIDIGSAGIAIQRSTVVSWGKSGESLHSALSWQDTRGKMTVDKINANASTAEKIKRLSGLPVSPHYGATKISWLCDKHNSDSVSDEYYCGPLISFILFNLLEKQPYLCDESNVGRTQLYDILNRKWSAQLCDIFDVDIKKLPKVVPVECDYGDLDLSFKSQGDGYTRSIPLKVVCGDQNSAYQYMSWVGDQTDIEVSETNGSKINKEPRTIAINSGSGAFVLTNDKRTNNRSIKDHTDATDKHFLQSLVFSNAEQTQYALEGTVNGVGTALSWILERWMDIDTGTSKQNVDSVNTKTEKQFFQSLDAWCTKGQTSYAFLNTVGGIGSPFWITGEKACFYRVQTLKECFPDISLNDQPATNIPRDLGAAILRSDLQADSIGDASVAVLESIIFLITINVEGILATQEGQDGKGLDESSKSKSTIVIGGGVSRSDYLCQGLSDLLNMGVRRIVDHDATVLGVGTMLGRLDIDETHVSNRNMAVDIGLDEFSPVEGNQTLFDRYRYFKQLLNTLK